jgi:hypothetical protein
MTPLRCGFCGWEGDYLGGSAELQQVIALQVGHVMPTLSLALTHMCCPRCDRQRIHLHAGSTPARSKHQAAINAPRPRALQRAVRRP